MFCHHHENCFHSLLPWPTHLTESRHCYWSDNLSSQTCLTILLKCDIKLREAFCSVTPSPLKWTYLNVVVTVSVATRKTRFYFMQGLLEQVWEVSMSRSFYWLNKTKWRENLHCEEKIPVTRKTILLGVGVFKIDNFYSYCLLKHFIVNEIN